MTIEVVDVRETVLAPGRLRADRTSYAATRKQEDAADLAAQDILIAAPPAIAPPPGTGRQRSGGGKVARALAGPRRPGCGDGLAKEAAGNGGSLWDHAAAVRPGLGWATRQH